jgi:hypothetical protein
MTQFLVSDLMTTAQAQVGSHSFRQAQFPVPSAPFSYERITTVRCLELLRTERVAIPSFHLTDPNQIIAAL